MSRNTKIINDDITIYFGNDHAIGLFLDVSDNRYAKSGKDEEGEGYVFEYSEMFKTSINKIKATIEEVKNEKVLIKKCNEFIRSLKEVCHCCQGSGICEDINNEKSSCITCDGMGVLN